MATKTHKTTGTLLPSSALEQLLGELETVYQCGYAGYIEADKLKARLKTLRQITKRVPDDAIVNEIYDEYIQRALFKLHAILLIEQLLTITDKIKTVHLSGRFVSNQQNTFCLANTADAKAHDAKPHPSDKTIQLFENDGKQECADLSRYHLLFVVIEQVVNGIKIPVTMIIDLANLSIIQYESLCNHIEHLKTDNTTPFLLGLNIKPESMRYSGGCIKSRAPFPDYPNTATDDNIVSAHNMVRQWYNEAIRQNVPNTERFKKLDENCQARVLRFLVNSTQVEQCHVETQGLAALRNQHNGFVYVERPLCHSRTPVRRQKTQGENTLAQQQATIKITHEQWFKCTLR